jgi:hypothetical protein
VKRLKEQYGDRQTVSRYARFVVRSFVDWGILKETSVAGSYEKSEPKSFIDRDVFSLLVYSTLLALPEGKASLSLLLNNPGLFPFYLPPIQVASLPAPGGRFKVVRYGLDDELVVLST